MGFGIADKGKRHWRICPPGVAAALFALLVAGAARMSLAGPAAWQDHVTGLALGGYDPVAYFTENGPRRGHPAIELSWRGAVWRFVSSGNRDAFRRHPDIYAPAFAGYDAYALSRGRTTPGEPTIWARHGGRIYLFHNAPDRKLWSEQRDAIVEAAKKNWEAMAFSLPSAQGF